MALASSSDMHGDINALTASAVSVPVSSANSPFSASSVATDSGARRWTAFQIFAIPYGLFFTQPLRTRQSVNPGEPAKLFQICVTSSFDQLRDATTPA